MKGAYSLRFSRSAGTYERWALPQRESARELVEFVDPEGYVLDLGCGTGFVSSFLPTGCLPVGVDVSESMLRRYVGAFCRGVLGDAENLPFRDKSFDYVLSNFSLHWTDLRRSLPEAIRVARRGVGVALPVEGSLEGLDFPFPSEEEVLSQLDGLSLRSYTRELQIPFSGWELVRFFHYTGSSINPLRRNFLTRRQIEDVINSIVRPCFRMLFVCARLK